MCAWRSRRGRARKARQKSLASVGVLLPTFSFVLSRSFLSSLPGLTRLRAEAGVFSASRNNPSADEGPAIHADLTLVKHTPPALVGCTSAWTTGIGVRRTPFCERLCPVVTSSETARTLRRSARTPAPSFSKTSDGYNGGETVAGVFDYETISRLGMPRDRPFLVTLQIGQTDIVAANNKTKFFGSASFGGES